MLDRRIRAIEWRDLLVQSRFQVLKELLLSTPWLAVSLYIAHRGYYIIALPFSFVFFLTGLRQVHNAYHYALGIPRQATEAVIFLLSVLMLGSMHAIQLTHLHHHRHCMDDEDVEAGSAKLSGLGALLAGPLFPLRLHRKALELAAPRHARWIWCELAATAMVIAAAFWIAEAPVLRYHVLAMAAGQCLTAFFAVWTVHRGCDGRRRIARTLRNPLKSVIVFDMFFHVEHHLFPKVPTCHLAKLAERIDRVAPELHELQVY